VKIYILAKISLRGEKRYRGCPPGQTLSPSIISSAEPGVGDIIPAGYP